MASLVLGLLAVASPGAGAHEPVPRHPLVVEFNLEGERYLTDTTLFSWRAVALAGDVNGDHVSDVVVGNETANNSAGVVHVLFGPIGRPAVNSSGLGERGFTITGRASDHLGAAVDAAGDVNGDGLADLVIGVPACERTTRGAVLRPGRK